jgi:hypothetical protein
VLTEQNSGPILEGGVTTRAALALTVDLASEVMASEIAERDKRLDLLAYQLRIVDAERELVRSAFDVTPKSSFASLVASRGEAVLSYLGAIRRSHERLLGADEAANHEWVSKHLKAVRGYASLASQGFIEQAKADEETAVELRDSPFAVRRPAAKAQQFLASLKSHGISADHRRMLEASGSQASDIAAYEHKLLATPARYLGMSIVEFYEQMANNRRALASSVDALAKLLVAASRGQVSKSQSQTFVVANPRDQTSTVSLSIRRISVPADWKISLLAAEPVNDGESQARLHERVTGQSYDVTLLAKGELRVASEVDPGGVVVEDTTVRWAVEGRIDNELIGGIIHEMIMPTLLANLELPPAGFQAQEYGDRELANIAIAGIIMLMLLAMSIVVIRARRR